MRNTGKQEPRRLWVKILITLIVLICTVPWVLGLVIDAHPQLLIGLFQGYQNQNSFGPRYDTTPGRAVKENGIVYLNDIAYADEYPNSYLDIYYPDENTEILRPTFLYLHGGGFFGGDKILGDPMAVNSDVNELFDRIILEGYNFVSINYALVPQYHFPTPELQMDQAIHFLLEHATEYHLDMTDVIIMGQSAGAILTAQYGAMLSNPEYAKLYGITPALSPEAVKCLIIDDAPLIFDHFDRNGKRLLGNFICGTSTPSQAQTNMYNPIGYVNDAYPATFLIGSNYRGNGYAYDMEQLSSALRECGVICEFFYDTYADGSEPMHGFLSNLKQDELAQRCYAAIIEFLKSGK